jgi:hypothetical protein
MHNNTEVEGIKGSLDIKGSSTFKFHIEYDKGGVHLIKIPNSKFVPDLKVFLSIAPSLGTGGKGLELYPICLLAVWPVSVSYRHLPVGIFGMVCTVFFCTVRFGGSSFL